MGERSVAFRVVRWRPSTVCYAQVLTRANGQREWSPVVLDGDTPADLARLLGDLAEALTRPILVERDGRLVEEPDDNA